MTYNSKGHEHSDYDYFVKIANIEAFRLNKFVSEISFMMIILRVSWKLLMKYNVWLLQSTETRR